jgi:hypothetical protein
MQAGATRLCVVERHFGLAEGVLLSVAAAGAPRTGPKGTPPCVSGRQ